MAEVSGLDMVREIIGQINNLRRLVTINGKKFKWDGKKYVRAVDGKKFTKKELVSYVKDEKFRAPGTDNPRKDPSRPQKQNLGDKLKSKTKSITSNIKKTSSQALNQGNKLLQNAKLRIGQPNPTSTKTNALKMNKYMRPNVTGKKGVVNAIGQAVANPLADQLVDRLGRNISGNQKMSLKDYRAMKDKNIQNLPNVLKILGMHRDASKPQRVIGDRGRTTGFIQPEQTGGVIGRRNEQYITREPTVSYEPEKVVTPPNQGTDSTKKNETVDKVRIKKVKFNPNAPDMGYDTKKTKKTKNKKLKVNKSQERRKKAIRRAYGNISDKRMKQLLSRAVTQRELEES